MGQKCVKSQFDKVLKGQILTVDPQLEFLNFQTSTLSKVCEDFQVFLFLLWQQRPVQN